MADQREITLWQGDATPKDIVLRALPVADVQSVTIYLYAGASPSTDIILRDPTAAPVGGGPFPTQFRGFRIFHDGGVVELCLVATADAPAAMGGQLRLRKNGTTYAVYLVETSDPNASSVRIRTTTGTKAIRIYTT